MRTRRARVVPRRTYRPRVLIIGRRWAKRHRLRFTLVEGIIVDDVAVDVDVDRYLVSLAAIRQMVRNSQGVA